MFVRPVILCISSISANGGHKEQLANHNDELLATIYGEGGLLRNPSNMSACAYVGTCRCGRSRAVDRQSSPSKREKKTPTLRLTMSMLLC